MAQEENEFSGEFETVSTTKARNWVFTLNNYADEDIEAIASNGARYVIIGKEVGRNGTPHLQGIIQFTEQLRRSALAKLPGFGRCYLAPARDVDRSIAYCKKDGDFYELGSPVVQGSRTDIGRACELLKSHGLRAVATTYPEAIVKYGRGLQQLQSLLAPERTDKPIVTWIYGPTGVGKTRTVYEKEKASLWLSSGSIDSFWNGYENQQAVLFDDFRADNCKFNWLLRILDRYPVTVNVKGSYVPFNSARIYITSPFHPKECYNVVTEDTEQLLRRIDHIIDLNPNPQPPSASSPWWIANKIS